MATNNCWKVIYHFENSTTHKQGWDQQLTAVVIAADSKEATIKNVLTTNNIARPGGTIAIDHVSSCPMPGGGSNVLS